MAKEKLLIVGAFKPDLSKGIGGGVSASCLKLKDSHINDEFELLLLDSTSKSNPPPPIFVRGFWAALRLYKFIKICYFERPEVVLLFASDGMSFLEKSLMGLLADYFGSRSFVFLRANRLVFQIKAKRLFRMLVRSLNTERSSLLCQGSSIKDFGHHYLGYKEDNIFVVPNWTAAVGESFAVAEVNHDRPEIKFIYVGWMVREKGLFTLLDAFKKLHQAHSGAQLSMIGDGNDFEKLRSVVNDYELGSCVKFYGWLEGLEVKNLLLEHHIFVLPSLSEGMSNAVIEAMSVGLPVFTTPVGVMPDYLKHDDSVIFVEPNNVEQLHAALLELYLDPEKRYKVAAAGKSLAIHQFSPILAIDHLISILKK